MCTFRASCYTPHNDAILYYDKYLVVNKGTYLSCRIFYCIYNQNARAHLYISNCPIRECATVTVQPLTCFTWCQVVAIGVCTHFAFFQVLSEVI